MGSGLGLSIVDELVRAHGGSCQMESALGEGTKFTFEIPLVPVDLEAGHLMPDYSVRDEEGYRGQSEVGRRSIPPDEEFEGSENFRTYSQLHGGVVEVFSVDDDPVNQMVIEGLLVPQVCAHVFFVVSSFTGVSRDH